MSGEYDNLHDVDAFVPRCFGVGPYWLHADRVGDKVRFCVTGPDSSGPFVDVSVDGVRFLIDRLREFTNGIE